MENLLSSNIGKSVARHVAPGGRVQVSVQSEAVRVCELHHLPTMREAFSRAARCSDRLTFS